mgnify:FL=1
MKSNKLPIRTLERDEDDEDMFPNKLGYSYRQEVRSHVTVHLNQPFMQPEYYDNVVDALGRASPEDIFEFKINSPGGHYSGLVSLLDAIENTDALVIANIVGDCSSAGSIFALKCHQVRVGPYGEMLCHVSRYGFNGKSPDNVSHVMHTAKVTENLMKEAYEGFLSESEIQEVISGKELYLDSEQIMERLEKREEYFEAKALAEEDTLEEQTKDLVFPPLDLEFEVDPPVVTKKKSKGK